MFTHHEEAQISINVDENIQQQLLSTNYISFSINYVLTSVSSVRFNTIKQLAPAVKTFCQAGKPVFILYSGVEIINNITYPAAQENSNFCLYSQSFEARTHKAGRF